jgi:hypothetical protein
MTNQHSLRIRPTDLRRVVADTLTLVGTSEGRQCFMTGVWVLPDDWKMSLPASFIAWAIMSREKSRNDPMILFQGQLYDAEMSMTVCADPRVMVTELRDFITNAEVLEAVYEEQFMDRVIQPLQLIHNLRNTFNEEEDSYERVEASVAQLEESIRLYAPDFC